MHSQLCFGTFWGKLPCSIISILTLSTVSLAKPHISKRLWLIMWVRVYGMREYVCPQALFQQNVALDFMQNRKKNF